MPCAPFYPVGYAGEDDIGQRRGSAATLCARRDDSEKAELLEMLVMMDSDAAWDVIDATLENGQ